MASSLRDMYRLVKCDGLGSDSPPAQPPWTVQGDTTVAEHEWGTEEPCEGLRGYVSAGRAAATGGGAGDVGGGGGTRSADAGGGGTAAERAAAGPGQRFDIIVAADVLYDQRGFDGLAKSIRMFSHPTTVCWIAYQDRTKDEGLFVGVAAKHGLACSPVDPSELPAYYQGFVGRLHVLQLRLAPVDDAAAQGMPSAAQDTAVAAAAALTPHANWPAAAVHIPRPPRPTLSEHAAAVVGLLAEHTEVIDVLLQVPQHTPIHPLIQFA